MPHSNQQLRTQRRFFVDQLEARGHLEAFQNDEERRLIKFRNHKAIENTLIRGDSTVELVNTNFIPVSIIDYDGFDHLIPPHDKEATLSYWWIRPGSSSVRNYVVAEAQTYHGFILEPIRVLAKGGNGVAILCKVTFEDGSTHRIVTKRMIRENADPDRMQKEADWHRRYARNPHVVQMVDLNREATKIAQAQINVGSPLKFLDGPRYDDSKALDLEYMEFGSLLDILIKLARKEMRLPNRVAWDLWECLVKGLAAVTYEPYCTTSMPGHSFEEMMGTYEESGDTGMLIDLISRWPASHDVHFDMEESNVLVGYDRKHHCHGPIFKLHDFSSDHSTKMRENWANWANVRYFLKASRVKRGKYTPEQFHSEWEDIAVNEESTDRFTGDNLSSGNKVAGRYGSWTNVYRIADTMHCALTLFYQLQPFNALPVNGNDEARSYGWRLDRDEYQSIDAELRQTIIACMSEYPKDRPTVHSLLKGIYSRKQAGFSESRTDVHTWWSKFLDMDYVATGPQNRPPPQHHLPIPILLQNAYRILRRRQAQVRDSTQLQAQRQTDRFVQHLAQQQNRQQSQEPNQEVAVTENPDDGNDIGMLRAIFVVPDDSETSDEEKMKSTPKQEISTAPTSLHTTFKSENDRKRAPEGDITSHEHHPNQDRVPEEPDHKPESQPPPYTVPMMHLGQFSRVLMQRVRQAEGERRKKLIITPDSRRVNRLFRVGKDSTSVTRGHGSTRNAAVSSERRFGDLERSLPELPLAIQSLMYRAKSLADKFRGEESQEGNG